MTEKDGPERPRVRFTGGGGPDLLVAGPERSPSRSRRTGTVVLAVLAGGVLLAVLLGRNDPAPVPVATPPVSSPVDAGTGTPQTARLYVSACDPSTGYRLQADGTLVQLRGTPAGGSSVRDGRPVQVGRSDCPQGLAFDGAGLLHVVGPVAPRVLVVAEGGVVRSLDGRVADPRPALGLHALLLSPDAVAVGRDGTVYVAGPTSTRVRRVDAGGVFRTLSGVIDPTATPVADPARPAQLAVDDELSVYFADGGTNSVYRVDRAGTATTYAGTGESGEGGDGGPALSAQLDDPRAVALDAAGRLYVSEGAGRRVRRIEPDGTLHTVAGTGRTGNGGDGGDALAATFTSPGDIAVGPAGDLFVVDLGAHAVRRIDPLGVIRTLGS